MTATDTELANESVDLLSQLIRNECVNDGTPESGFESRSADLLAQYLGDSGLDLERYEAQPGRENLVARIEGTDPDRAHAVADGPHRCRARESRRLAARSLRRRGRRRRRVGPGRGRHVEPHRHHGRCVPRARALGLPTAGHARVSRGRRRGEPRHVGRGAPARPRARRGARRLRRDRGGRFPDADRARSAAAGDRRARRARTGVASRFAARPGTRRNRSVPTTRSVTAAEIVKRLAEYRPPTQIHETWRRFIEGVDFGPEWNKHLLDEATLADFCEELPIGLARQAHACTHTTFAPTVISGGTKTNVIPDAIELEVDIRTLPGQRSSDIKAMLEDALGDLIACTEITPFDENESTSSPTDTPLWDAMGRVSSALVDGSALVPFLTVGATDARFFRRHGIGRVRVRAVQPQALVRRLRVDVPRQRRARRHRVTRAVDRASGTASPATSSPDRARTPPTVDTLTYRRGT